MGALTLQNCPKTLVLRFALRNRKFKMEDARIRRVSAIIGCWEKRADVVLEAVRRKMLQKTVRIADTSFQMHKNPRTCRGDS